MTIPEPSIRVNVDPTNPGQFFACCGLLELADRLWPGAEGWFAESGREFRIACGGTLKDVLDALVKVLPDVVLRLECNGLDIPQIIAPLALSLDGGESIAITLDAWIRVATFKGTAQVASNPPWNFWSGQQTSIIIWSALRVELMAQLPQLTIDDLANVLSKRLLQRGRFGFDPGPAWNALDVGFSPNEHGMEVESCPAVEMLAAVGIQRFRPVMREGRESFDYFTWHAPLAPLTASAAMAGGMRTFETLRFRGSVVSRGQYAALGISYPIPLGDSDE